MCCLGQPVAGNPTQYMMEKSFQASRLDCRFLTLEVSPENLDDAVRGMRAMGFRGAKIAEPHKAAIIAHLDHCSDEVQLIGAVNCVHRNEDGVLTGENTEGKGFCRSLLESYQIKGKNVVLLGAGWAGRAIAVELGLAGAGEITVVNRNADRGQGLADLLSERVKVSAMFFPWNGEFEVGPETDLVINATSIGDADPAARIPVAAESLKPSMTVADIVLGSPTTPFLRDAESQGCQVINGQGMAVGQVAQCFRIWTGKDPDTEVMREALEEFLEL